ncbi:MAG: wax ester/triacylglycerol synthase family O-acyltransferase [Actinomycetota bacterium]|nr:wax ester/triacylglycerol synthase family O-acyltransferase [Actinomycetota bacterium]
MTVRRLEPVDAQMYWMSGAIPNDQFLVYAFDGATDDIDSALELVLRRARARAELAVRIAEGGFWTYPVWEPCQIGADRFEVHRLADPGWSACLEAVAELAERQLDPRSMPWRLHVFGGVEGLPGGGAGVVAVLQISHALGDGNRSSALAAHLFGRDEPVPNPVASGRRALSLPLRAAAAARAHRALVRDTAAGLVPGQGLSRPALRSNAPPGGERRVRTVVCERGRLAGPTVTVGSLAAVGAALSAHLSEGGADTSALGAEVPMAKAGPRRANNHFGNVGIGLHPQLPFAPRCRAIAAELHQRRRRAAHPAMRAEAAAFAAVPAPLLRWGIAQFDPTVRSDTVTGNTVVSSVNRGAADLRFGSAPVVLTTGLPGLSPMMGVTHGVHGIGDTIAISVHAAASAIGDIDAYVERLQRELSG